MPHIDPEVDRHATPQQLRAICAYRKHGSYRKAAQALGINVKSCSNLIERAINRATAFSTNAEGMKLREAAGTHPIAGDSVLYNGDGDILLHWAKTSKDADAIRKMLEEFARGLAEELPKPKKIPKCQLKQLDADRAVMYIIGDAHLGLRSWEVETGENYELRHGIADHIAAATYCAETTPSTEIGYLINVGDLLHCNDGTEVTPQSKHKLDADSRFPLVARRAAGLLKSIIYQLATKHQFVKVINAKGNHDRDPAWWINEQLRDHFSLVNDRVEVLPNESKVIPFEFGENFICVYHGDKVNPQRMHGKITKRWRREHGRARRTYAFNGHIHHNTVHELGGIHFETFGSLVATDAYHEEAGYGADRSMEAIVMHKQYGMVGRCRCPQELARELACLE